MTLASVSRRERELEKKINIPQHSKASRAQRRDSSAENWKLSFLPEDSRIPGPSSNIIADHFTHTQHKEFILGQSLLCCPCKYKCSPMDDAITSGIIYDSKTVFMYQLYHLTTTCFYCNKLNFSSSMQTFAFMRLNSEYNIQIKKRHSPLRWQAKRQRRTLSQTNSFILP